MPRQPSLRTRSAAAFKRSARREVRRLSGSRRHRRLIQPATVWLPSIRTDTRAGTARVRARFRRAPVQRSMRSMAVIVTVEIEELHLQIRGRPEQSAVQTFAPNGANQPFNEGMGERHVRHGLDFPDVEDTQIRCHWRNRYRESWSELR